MNEILSQEEIEKLLSSIDINHISGTSVKRRGSVVKMYDFRRPDKFSKEQIRTIQMIHETYARLTTTSLSAQLRSFVNIHVNSVEQLSYEEFSRGIPTPSTLAIVNMDPLKGSVIIEIDPHITFTIIDRLFGGSGESLEHPRELTDIELSVVESVIIRILGNLREAWSSVVDLKPKFSNIETNVQFAQIVPPSDMVVLIALEIKIGNVVGVMNFCIPYITIESIVPRLSAQFWYSNMRNIVSTNVEVLRDSLMELFLEPTVEVGRATLKVQDVLSLEVGDLVMLEQKVKDNLRVYLGGKLKYLCELGTVGSIDTRGPKRMGARITSVFREEEKK